jgi:hypothetical protein
MSLLLPLSHVMIFIARNRGEFLVPAEHLRGSRRLLVHVECRPVP